MGADGGSLFLDPAYAFPNMIIPQGISADLIATKYGYSREDLDSYALQSQVRAKQAWDAGYFSKVSLTGQGCDR